MSIIFLNTLLIPLLILTALPLLLHLFSRAKPPLYEFSSNRFLNLIVKQTKRIRKPQDIILLILRTLLFAAVILMFLQPLFFSDSRLAALQQKKNVVIIVDASSSMGYIEGGQTRFASACAEAAEIIRGLSSGDSANIIYLKSRPEALFPLLGSNFNYLASELRKARVSNQPGNVRAAVRKALDMLEKAGDGVNEICIISDFQTTQWKESIPLDIPDDVAVTFVETGSNNADNQAITKVSAAPLLPLLGEEVAFNCDISNFSPAPRRITLYFQAGEMHESSSILIPAWGSVSQQFRMSGDELKHESGLNAHTPSGEGLPGVRKPGIFSYQFSIGEDNFPEDNRRWGVLKVAKNLKTAVAEFSHEPGATWKRALSTLPWIDVKTLSLDTVTADDHFDFLFLSGWDGSSPEKIMDLINSGTVVICAPAQGLDIQKLKIFSPPHFKESLSGSLSIDNAEKSKPFRLKIMDAKDKIFAIFADGEYGDPVGGYQRKRVHLPKNIFDNGKTLISYSDSVPALIRGKTENSNQFYIWNIPLDLKYSNFAGRVQFLPLLAEIILSSRFNVGDIAYLADYIPGDPLVTTADFAGSSKDITLKTPKGTVLPLKIDALPSGKHTADAGSAPLSLVSPPTTETGIYTWSVTGETISKSVVNFPVSESDMRCMSKSELSAHGTSVVSGAGSVNNIHKGVMLWPYLLAFALLIALCEGLVMLWSERVEVSGQVGNIKE